MIYLVFGDWLVNQYDHPNEDIRCLALDIANDECCPTGLDAESLVEHMVYHWNNHIDLTGKPRENNFNGGFNSTGIVAAVKEWEGQL